MDLFILVVRDGGLAFLGITGKFSRLFFFCPISSIRVHSDVYWHIFLHAARECIHRQFVLVRSVLRPFWLRLSLLV